MCETTTKLMNTSNTSESFLLPLPLPPVTLIPRNPLICFPSYQVSLCSLCLVLDSFYHRAFKFINFF